MRRPTGGVLRPLASYASEDEYIQANLERFWSYVDKSGDCWEWIGHRTKKGYGTLGWMGKTYFAAHRLSFRLAHGRWPEGLVCHHCDNPPCVNPAHLYEGDAFTNMRDKAERFHSQCKRGHPYTAENIIPCGPDGKWRKCRTCQQTVHKRHQRERMRVVRSARRAAKGEINFAAHQQLPPGYCVVWDEGTEHYMWRNGDRESDITCDKWAAWRGAWADYRTPKHRLLKDLLSAEASRISNVKELAR